MSDYVATTAQRISSLSFVIFMLVIGVPIWWHTTSVYRAALPYSTIAQFDDSLVKLPFKVSVVSTSKGAEAVVTELVKKNLRLNLATVKLHSNVHIGIEWLSELASDEFQTIFRNAPNISSADLQLCGLAKSSSQRLNLYLTATVRNYEAYLGKCNNFYLNVGSVLQSNEIYNSIKKLVLENFVGIEQARECLRRAFKLRDTDAEARKATPQTSSYVPSYTTDVSLMIPEPQNGLPVLNFTRLNAYLKSELNRFSRVGKFTTKLQHLFEADLKLRIKLSSDGKFNYVHSDQLPLTINAAESFLSTSSVSENQVFNILLYIPRAKHNPLWIVDSQMLPVVNNAFVVAGWGGVAVLNPPEQESTSIPESWTIDEKMVAETILSQLKILLGVSTARLDNSNQIESNPLKVDQNDEGFLSDWQVTRVEAIATLNYLLLAQKTLSSLTESLSKISNIVINDKIAEEIHLSVDAIGKSHQALSEGKMRNALKWSKKAYVQSEKAFFDPSLLALLYFPEDQKYAIYVPLFVPVGVPVLLSVYNAVKSYIRRGKDKSKTE